MVDLKQRYAGRVRGGLYEVLSPAGAVVKTIPIEEARDHSKLAAAIQRNGWEQIPEE